MDRFENRIPTVKFDLARVTASVIVEIRKCVWELDELTAAEREAIYPAALESVNRGRDLHVLFKAIESVASGKMVRRAMEEACHYVHNRASTLMDIQQMEKIGIAFADWEYSGAPCKPIYERPGSDYSRQDDAHRNTNGKRFKIAEGLLVDGKQTWPGWDRDCKCISRPIVPGFD